MRCGGWWWKGKEWISDRFESAQRSVLAKGRNVHGVYEVGFGLSSFHFVTDVKTRSNSSAVEFLMSAVKRPWCVKDHRV